MNAFWKSLKKGLLLTSLLSIALGIWMIARPQMVENVLQYLLGGALTVFGLFEIVFAIAQNRTLIGAQRLVPGVLCLAVGLVFLFRFSVFADLIWVIVGIALLVDAVYKLQYAFELKYALVRTWWLDVVAALVTLLFAVLTIMNPFAARATTTVVVGILLVISGLADSMSFVLLVANRKALKNTSVVVISDAQEGETPLLHDSEEAAQD